MAKEIFAIIMLLLIFFITMYNTWYIEELVDRVMDRIDASEAYAVQGNSESSIEEMTKATDIWEASNSYIRSHLDQTNADHITDGFYNVLGDLISEDYSHAEISYSWLRSHLIELADMEKISLTSIF
jgi:hypothetical protein